MPRRPNSSASCSLKTMLYGLFLGIHHPHHNPEQWYAKSSYGSREYVSVLMKWSTKDPARRVTDSRVRAGHSTRRPVGACGEAHHVEAFKGDREGSPRRNHSRERRGDGNGGCGDGSGNHNGSSRVSVG